jgi:hypothetical protein
MLFGYLTLFTALIISLSAAVYSILGLTAIFAAAFWPIVIMGGSLEFGKIVTTLWLHKYWDRAELQYKLYLCSAVAVLMFLTSMGVFGFLSKAHSDQALVSGDVTSKLEIYDEKIKTAKENIESDRKQIKQMDEAVDQVMARSTTEGGADKSNAIRRSQARDRASLAKDIEANQKIISQLNDQAAPIRAEVRKVEAEVGPIKYIAAMVYGDNPDANLLEHAVRWVIILIVAVFDPLALTLLLAATKTFEWEKGVNIFAPGKKRDDEYDNTWSNLDNLEPVFDREVPPVEETDIIAPTTKKEQILNGLDSMWNRAKNLVKQDPEAEHAPLELIEDLVIDDQNDDDEHGVDELEKQARRLWKEANPGETIKKHRRLYENGQIADLPWNHPTYQEQLGLVADNAPAGTTGTMRGFGTSFPDPAAKGDMFLRVDQLPSVLYKFNGIQWIEVDKALSDQHAYDDAYIDHLIAKISTGEYDPDLLSDAERDSIEHRLNSK